MIAAFGAVTTVVLFAIALFAATRRREDHSDRGIVLLAVLCPPILLSIALFLLRAEQPLVPVLTRIQLLLRLLVFLVCAILYNLPVAFLFCRRALAAMPNSLHEAALLEGASSVQRFMNIVLPIGGMLIAVGILAVWAQSLAAWAILMAEGAKLSLLFDASSMAVRLHHVALAIAASVVLSVVALVLQYRARKDAP